MALYNPFKSTVKPLRRFLYVQDNNGPTDLPTGVTALPCGYIAQLTDEDGNVYQQSESYSSPEEAGDYWQVETAIQLLDVLMTMDDNDCDVDTLDYLYYLACSYVMASKANLIIGWNDV